jgi:D-alanine-D-alanine ligase
MKVLLLLGGSSAERPISLTTGAGVAAALRRLGHEVTALDPATGQLLPAGRESEAPVLEPGSVGPLAAASGGGLVRLDVVRGAEVVFIALHGGDGEDGTLQAVLDLAGATYTGSGRLASGLAMDKAMSKRLFEHAGIPTPRWLVLPSRGPAPDPADVEPLGGYPVVVKPNDQGSTVGLTVVRDESGLADAFRLAARWSGSVLVESYIPGRELTVSMLGSEPLPVVEIFPEHGIYDYACKYTPGMSRYEAPASLPVNVATRLQELGRRAYEVLGCSGVGRVDFRLDPEGRAYCLEVNTVPGMTPTSLVPMAAKARGLSYDQLVARMLELAVAERDRARPQGAGATG